jgi:peptidoglycan/LPS O-acetylase OafA/YrhL
MLLFFLALSIILILVFDVTMANDTSLIICFIGFIGYLASNNDFISLLFSKKPFVFLGDISFGIYILQYPVKNIFDFIFYKQFQNHFTIYFYSYLLILISIATFSYIFIEKPILAKVKSMLKK